MMTPGQKKRLVRLTGDNIRFDCPMASYTTFRVGGRGEALFKAEKLGDLRKVITYSDQEHIPYLVVGRGSNLLLKDDGISGLLILLVGELAGIKQERPDKPVILAGGGLPLVDLLSYCRDRGLKGLEWAAGIPGTVGGAANINAGAYGQEFGSIVQEIQALTPKGDLEVIPQSRLRFSYRNLDIEEGYVIVHVSLKFEQDTKNRVKERMTDCLRKKKLTQPLEYPSAGSVFKNPPHDFAGRLIEKVGLKGKKIGGAMISDKHANFIVNMGDATAQDILDLMNLAKTTVKQKTDIDLEPEIRVVGN